MLNPSRQDSLIIMRVLKINPDNFAEFPGVIGMAVQVLRKGGSVIYPTDTIYGLGVDATKPEAVARLFKIKKRPAAKPVSIIVSSMEMARKAAYIDKRKEEILRKIWPSPITVVLHKKDILPDVLTGGNDAVGIRIPNSKIALVLVKSLSLPITVTSANISGEEPGKDIRDIMNRFKQENIRPDLVLDGGVLPVSKPSTVLDWTASQPIILRAGPFKKEEFLSLLGI